MKAIVKDHNIVKIEDLEIPVIDETNNVLIQVKLSGICRTDINVSKGIIPCLNKLVIGHEFYGEVADIYSNVENLKIGDKVTIDPTKFGEDENLMCGVDIDGAFAEYIKVPARLVFKLPAELSPEVSAYVEPVAASLAVLNANLNKDEIGCIYGKNRISELTYRILKAKGYNNISIQDENSEIEKDKYDYIIETVSSTKTMTKIIEAIKRGGKIVLKSRQYNPVEIVINSLVKKNITMAAVNYGDFNEAIELLASGKLDISDLVGITYKLDNFKEAFLASEKSEAKKIYVEV